MSGEWVQPVVVLSILVGFTGIAILWLRNKWEKEYGVASGEVLVEHIFANGGSEKVWRKSDGNWLIEREEGSQIAKLAFKFFSSGKKQPETAIDAMNLLLSDFCYESLYPEWAPRTMQVTCRKTVIVDGIVQPISNRSGHDWLQNPKVIAGVVNSNSLKVSHQATEALTETSAELAELRSNKGISSRMSTMIIIWALGATIAAVMFANQIYQFIPGGEV